MPAVKKYHIAPLTYDQNLVDLVTRRRTDGESISAIAKALNMGLGKTAMMERIGTTERVEVADPAKLARLITKERKSGASWAHLAARYGVSEGTVRAAYNAVTGQPHSELDYRRRKPVAKRAPAKPRKEG
jgi:hypothetical protein